MGILETLRRIEPDLHAEVTRRGAAVASPRERQALADGLRLRAAAMAAHELRAEGATSLDVAGGRELAAQLLACGALDAFPVVRLMEEHPTPHLPVPGRGLVPCVRLGGEGVNEALLLLDESIPASFAAPTRLVPRLDAYHIPFAVPDFWRAPYAAHLEAQKMMAQEELERLDLSRTVLFAGIYAYFNFCKLSLALRRKGLQTAFLCLNPSNQAFKQGFFDAVLDAGANLELFYSLLATIRCRAVHFQGWLGLHCFAAAAALVAASPVVTEFNDLPQYCFTDEDYDRLFGLGEAAAERASVRTALAASAGAALNYRKGSEEFLFSDAPARPPFIHLHSWPLPDFFADRPVAVGGRSSLVFCGTLNPSNYPRSPFGDVQLLPLIRELTEQGLDFHLFLNPYQRKKARGEFWDYEYFEQAEPRFTLHEGVGPEELPWTIAGFGWGCMLHRFPEGFTVCEAHMRNLLPTKFFSYLEAGLPMLVSDRIGAVSDLVREHALGLVVKDGDLCRLGEFVREMDPDDYDALRRNVRVWRAANSLDGKLGGLLSLYRDAVRPLGHDSCIFQNRGKSCPRP